MDIYMEGATEGWIAVGFTETPNMFSADVLACNFNPVTTMVEALDTWNPNSRANNLDTNQDVFLFSGELRNGRITCTIGRLIAGTGSSEDLNLNGDYYIIYGRRTRDPAPGVLRTHVGVSPNPSVSSTLSNPAPPRVGIPKGVSMPSTAPSDLPLVFRDPVNCDVGDCNIYVGIERNEGNEEYLNFYIEGEASAWVAVGFTPSPDMLSADVFACNLNPEGEVEILDTWNVAQGRNNIPDTTMDTFAFSSFVEDGRIKCRFGRSIAGAGDSQDLDLNNNYYVLFGLSNGGQSTGRLTSHRSGGPINPSISSSQVNVTNTTGVQSAGDFGATRRILIQTHGILMLIAWPLLATTGIFFASYMRPALPNGEWFQAHRALMIASLLIAAAGFITIFFSQLESSPPGLITLGSEDRTRTAHFSIGVLVMLLQILNPIIALFRCHPGEKNRWVFNVLHGFPGIGTIAEIGALTNVGIGLSLFSTEFTRFGDHTLLWVFVGFSSFNILLNVSMVVLSMLCTKRKKESHDGFAVKADKTDTVQILDKKDEQEQVNERKSPSPDSPFRWIGLVTFVTVTILVVLTLLVLIALPLE